MRGFTLVRVLAGLTCLITLFALAVIMAKPAHAQAGRTRVVHQSVGAVTFSSKTSLHVSMLVPAIHRLGGGGGGGGGSFRTSGFFDVFLEFHTQGGTTQRVKVQFHWDRTSDRDELKTVDIVPTSEGFTWTVDTEAPTLVVVPGLPPGTPYVGRCCPVLRFADLHPNDPDPACSIMVSNIGSSGQDGVSVNFFDIFLE